MTDWNFGNKVQDSVWKRVCYQVWGSAWNQGLVQIRDSVRNPLWQELEDMCNERSSGPTAYEQSSDPKGYD